ncbi:MAG: VCBS repeat-containing protein, partial [Planctomycetes bacterium]|nr:VCBS repeat-containing protein [Planctomycetota bacterium]
ANRAALKTSRACDVAVADLNADGCDEVILCQCHTRESYSNPSFLYRGTRQGVSSVPVQLPTEDARRVFVTQGTRDTDSRVVFVNHFSRGVKGNVDALIYLGGPEGYTPSRKVALPGWGAVEAVCADLNDDGRVDVVLANCSENSVSDDPGSYVFFHGPNGLPHSPSLRLPTTRAHGVCCADVNRDGYLDLIFVGFTNPEILVFHGTRDGFDTAHPVRIRLEHGGVKYDQPRWIYLVDLNNDGWLDLVVPQIAFDRSFVLWGGPDGFSMKNCQVLSVERAACARAADLTGNGYADLILGGHAPSENTPHDSFVYIYWNGPEGLRNDRRCMLPASGINSLCVADFNNDGLLDLFVGSYHAVKSRDVDSYLYWNRKDRGFSASDCKRLFTHSASGCVAADFNEDGWIDLAVANHKVWGDHRGYSEVWWNGPDGFDPRRTTRLPTWGPHGMTAVGPGNILTRGPEEYYESCPHQLPRGASPTRISWQAEAPPKTWVKAQLRSAHSKDALSSAPWLGPDGPGSWFENGQRVAPRSLSGEWIQYRLALGATNSVASPRVTEVAVEYEG